MRPFPNSKVGSQRATPRNSCPHQYCISSAVSVITIVARCTTPHTRAGFESVRYRAYDMALFLDTPQAFLAPNRAPNIGVSSWYRQNNIDILVDSFH
ncbi:hypothetical protein M404DRAFT_1004239 [Pisolithus tinctorius Marx 270]|uniref:Uncharacterized protein n=1 Tax=Pisolithus tinctorius Marx 270 TaxID=870435 RepID=A0A0C3JR21_PISTI|nr:hypothetical protein M404DRAFT_1004239 [Pisolithus tinctorius Marx 270]